MFCTVVDVSSVIEFICSVAAERFCAEKLTLSAVVLIILMMPEMFEKSSFNAKPSFPSSSSDLMSTMVVRSPALFASARLAMRSWAMGRFSSIYASTQKSPKPTSSVMPVTERARHRR